MMRVDAGGGGLLLTPAQELRCSRGNKWVLGG